jgi:hypothetical protein
MGAFLFLALLTAAANLFALGFSVAVVIRGRVRLTGSRTLRGAAARLIGVACLGLTILFWWFSSEMWSLADH